MSAINDGGPAFPSLAHMSCPQGMSLRDWFAGQAAAGLASIEDASNLKVAEWAYEVADAMLAARSKPKV